MITDAERDAALARFTPGSGAYRIAEALLDADDWTTRTALAADAGVRPNNVPLVALKLRAGGVDVRTRRTDDRGEAEYRIAGARLQPTPVHLVDDGEQVAA